jgi:hypothetical protein
MAEPVLEVPRLKRGRNMTWDEATRIADAIAESPDAGAWHARVAVAQQGHGYAVMVREHNHHEMYYIGSVDEFKVLCDRLMTPGH